MKSLRCATCKFTLSVSPEEAQSYAEQLPMHCGAPMLSDEEQAPEQAAEAKPEEPKKKAKKKKGS